MISTFDRILFLFPMMVGGWMLVTIVACNLAAFGNWKVSNIPLLLLVAIFFVTPLIAWFVFRAYQIVRSVSRFNMRGKTRTA